jgi:hypothetical protein
MKKLADKVMILGGAGLVGFQIARQIAKDLKPSLIVIISLSQQEVRDALSKLRKEFPTVTFDGAWGDVFVRSEFAEKTRKEIVENQAQLYSLFNDVFGEKSAAYESSMLVESIVKFKPDIIVDGINTATAISYQDVYISSIEIGNFLREESLKKQGAKDDISITLEMAHKINGLLVSQSIPQLIRHVQLLHDAMVKVGTRIYLKIGTTGTGGMGLNIPYTHSEDKPSAKLMSKTAVAFAHTGLLFLMARTPASPIVKEIKPAALIGYRKVDYRLICKAGKAVPVFQAKKIDLGKTLNIAPDVGYAQLDELKMVGVDTGENGFFTRGEFGAITTMYQMEFITPEEIAQNVVLEISGSNTGKDVIAAIDGAVMDPSYRAGILRAPVIEEMKALEDKTNSHSIALGQLGPPELSKLLYEAHLLKSKYSGLQEVINADPAEISQTLENHIIRHPLRHVIVSIGVPILLCNGTTLLRGPRVNIPEYSGVYELEASAHHLNKWASKGWVDLRVENIKLWQERFRMMQKSRSSFIDQGSAAYGRGTYLDDTIEIGEAVGWIFNNDPEILGYRIKAL